MKQNQHQVGGKNNRPAQAKQARKQAGKTPRGNNGQVGVCVPMPAALAQALDARALAGETKPGTPSQPALREVFGSNHEDQDLMVSTSGPEQFYIRQQGVEGEPVRPITRAEAVAWFTDSFVPDELLPHFTVPKAAQDKLGQALNAQYETNAKNEALLHLLHGQINAEESEGVFGLKEGNGRLSGGIMLLCQGMAREVEARHKAVSEAVKAIAAGKEGAR